MPELAAQATPWPLTGGAWSTVARTQLTRRTRLVFSLVMLLGILLAAGQVRAAPFVDASMAAKLQSQYGAHARIRGLSVNRLVERLRFADVATQLTEVNRFFNRFDYRSDSELWNKSDYWTSPVEFIGRHAGDCEDFAITKYFVLRALGVPDRDLAIAYVRDTRRSAWHMVLLYQAPDAADALVLDSQNSAIEGLKRRQDLVPVYDFNTVRVSIRARAGRVQKARPVASAGHREWKRLLAASSASESSRHPLARPQHRGSFLKTGFSQP